MRVDLPFGRGTVGIEVPDGSTVLRPPPVAPLADPIRAVAEALERPIAGLPLRDRVRPGDRVAIVVSDITRPVPNQLILPPVLNGLRSAGVSEDQVVIINGTGLHRANKDAELAEMLGHDILDRYEVVQHVARDRSTLIEVGRLNGLPVEFCRSYVEANVRIVTGFVEPHLFAGYSGGAKGVMPGVAGTGLVMQNHGAANLADPRSRWCISEGNPVFEQIQAAVELCPPSFLLNVTIDSERRLTGVFGGDLGPTHKRAIAQAERQYVTPIGSPFDVVVVTNMGYPADTTLYQSIKGISVAGEAVRDGGAIILIAGCEEGLGSDDYVEGLAQGDSAAALLHQICHGDQPRLDQWQIQIQAMVQAKARVFVYSGMKPDQVRLAHLEPVEDVTSLARSLIAEARLQGRTGSVLVIPHGQMTVPMLHAQSRH